MSNFQRFLDSEIPFYFIAEGADAHYGSLSRAKEMIVLAKDAGCDAIKFQHHIPDEEMLPDVPMSGNMQEPLYDFLKRNALVIEQHVELSEYCKEIGIDYLCTPFSWKAAQELEAHISPIAYKIGSGELLDHPTHQKIMSFGKPMILSTGMSTVKEIEFTYSIFAGFKEQLVLMNCTSAYPPKPEDVHLSFISEMREKFPKAIIGHSDHTSGIETTIAAFCLGAKVFEKHVTVSHELTGPDSEVSLDFSQVKSLIEMLNKLDKSLRAKKEIHQSELEIREWAHRSLVYLSELAEGHELSEGDIWGKRPGTGVPSFRYHEFIGKTLKRNVNANTLISENDFVQD